MENNQSNQKIYFYNPIWLPIYTTFCVIGSFPFLLITLFVFHVSVASDIVFGILVILGGPLGDIIFRRIFRKAMCFIPSVKIQAIYAWPVIGLLVMLFRPFE